MKMLFHSNAPWAATGYGQQTRIFAPKIRDAGVDIAVSCAYGLNGASTTWNGITLYPGVADAYGNDVISTWAMDHLGHPNNGWLVILYDAWVFQAPTIGNFHNAVWVPVDHDPIPPAVLGYFERFKGLPIAMSQFGVDKFAEHDIEALYVPHGFDDFYSPRDKSEARKALGLPAGAFVVGMNMANKGRDLHRKAFGEQLQAFADFARKRSDAILYLHTEQYGHTNGWNLENYVAALGISDKVRFVDQMTYRLGVPAEAMPHMYSAFDVLMNATMGEGFGIPIIEAQASGVPVIVTDSTAMPEIARTGWIVEGQRLWHEAMQSWWVTPNIGDMTQALTEAYEKRHDPVLVAQGVEEYRAANVFAERWLPVLANMQERINPQAVAA
jgi:glycosyltransferase involved in cell wall biosynthesis